ncbi:MAG: glucose-6-phosphate dehydrogenase [Acidimicrobiia bacterium]|nr:glucose-6-phosphate dehydrogenase [Acidimicrobiia bacterium]
MDPVEPHLFVIFGATGDLTGRKLIPSIFRVLTEDGVAAAHNLLGVARTNWSDDDFRQYTNESLHGAGYDGSLVEEWCRERVFYHPTPGDSTDLESLRERIESIEADLGLPGNRVFYLALPPAAFGKVIDQLGDAGLASGPGWTRLVVEKPFGHDAATAHDLNARIHAHFEEHQVYRIDHYLGKETVQNLLAFRFANLLFESAWNRDRVDHIEITVAESLGTEGRAGYYDNSGVLRDMVQNHITQLLSLITMEAPNAFEADEIRSEKVDVLQAIAPIDVARVVYGHYETGIVDGEPVPGYREDPDVADDSQTPTFVALRLAIDNWRWQGVPIFIRTGKRLPHKTTQIAVTFQRPPVCIFHGVRDDCIVHQNVAILTLQPNEGFEVRFDVKAPGSPLTLVTQPLHFDYDEAFEKIPDAYQTLILDVMEGDQTLFVRSDEVETSWELYTPLLEADIPVLPYAAGTWGPAEVNERLGMADDWVMRDIDP